MAADQYRDGMISVRQYKDAMISAYQYRDAMISAHLSIPISPLSRQIV